MALMIKGQAMLIYENMAKTLSKIFWNDAVLVSDS